MIRKAAIADIPQINSLLEQVLMVHYSIRPDLFKPNTKKYTDSELADIINDNSTPIFVWTDEQDLARGYAFCQLKSTFGQQNMQSFKSIYIDDICVDECWRGRHIASSLFEHVKSYARSIGCHNITLNVWEGNDPARAFYERMGMEIQKTTMETVLD